MAIVINGSGTVTGLAVGGLPDDTVDEGSLANSINTSIGAKLPKAGGSMTGNLELNDNVKAAFGQSGDLEIFHDGSNSIIKDIGTGNLQLNSSGAGVIMQNGSSEIMGEFLSDGAVKLYHNAAKKFETIAGGCRIPSGGLLFGSDTAAANALDDYEEGTFTLAMYSGQSGTITNHFAKYTKIGRNVTLNFRGVINDAKGNNYVRISGFPFSLPNIHYPATANYSYSQSVQLFMSNGGYFYYQSTTVGGNNQGENTAWLNSATGISINVTYVS